MISNRAIMVSCAISKAGQLSLVGRSDGVADRKDSPHLRYVSSPLAAANITILYQSSYHADFLLVKETDFEQASAIFTVHDCESSVPPTSCAGRRKNAPITIPADPL